jgi:hypothetical protein
MAAARWTRTDDRPWRKCSARWTGPGGWRLEHCGHPTANWPWALYDAEGVMHVGFNQRAWPNLEDAVAYVRNGAESVPVMPGRVRSSVPYVDGARYPQ